MQTFPNFSSSCIDNHFIKFNNLVSKIFETKRNISCRICNQLRSLTQYPSIEARSELRLLWIRQTALQRDFAMPHETHTPRLHFLLWGILPGRANLHSKIEMDLDLLIENYAGECFTSKLSWIFILDIFSINPSL